MVQRSARVSLLRVVTTVPAPGPGFGGTSWAPDIWFVALDVFDIGIMPQPVTVRAAPSKVAPSRFRVVIIDAPVGGKGLYAWPAALRHGPIRRLPHHRSAMAIGSNDRMNLKQMWAVARQAVVAWSTTTRRAWARARLLHAVLDRAAAADRDLDRGADLRRRRGRGQVYGELRELMGDQGARPSRRC
jgi:hypothetical protein